jgi:acyl dehydratase
MTYQPRGLTFEQFTVGDVHVCQGRTVTEADVVHFAGVSGDYNPLHTNEEYGKTTPFGGRIAHGVLILALATGQINQTGLFEGTTLALLQQTIKYVGAVKFGDTVHLEFKIAEKKETSKGMKLANMRLKKREEIEREEMVLIKRGKMLLKLLRKLCFDLFVSGGKKD